MNARREGPDIFSNAPIHYASRSTHDETTLTALLNNQTFAYALVAIFSVYLFLDHFGFAPVSLIRLLWNILVYLTPSRLVVAQ